METLRARICYIKTHPAGCIDAPHAPGRPLALRVGQGGAGHVVEMPLDWLTTL